VDVDDGGPWMARDDEDFERRIVQEKASAHDLCLALRWHHASIAETLPVVDEDGDVGRMAEVRRVIAALGRAREELVAYYKLPPADATDEDPYARGDPPRIHGRDEPRRVLDGAIHSARGQAQRHEAIQQLMLLLGADGPSRVPPRRQPGVIARLFGCGRRPF